ncbi:type II toxin-antitoxin system RelE/ParE family toxin [Polaromonas glacialis]|uniref:type II toxin-antitoxin system RelE/ParE family toxin n=1 Tax=Polaromonas glacialis TaxID=866564 RepID=UPI000497D38F|nr:type II toxin-antitoxin system RelE/ParE family toxin [Polaromonas glacialis]
MIECFKHKGLKKLFNGDRSGVSAELADRIENILAMLSVAEKLKDLSLPSLKLHPLKGDLKGFHAVTVRANWRIVFRFEDGDCFDVDLVDYH